MPNFFTPPVTGARGSYFGDSGGATSRYYWIQAIYPSGRSRLNGYTLVTTPAALSNKNVVLLVWTPMPGAIGYNIFKTSTTTQPTSGSIAVALGVTAPNFTDIGQSDSLVSGTVFIDGLSGVGVARARYDFSVDGGAIATIQPGAAFNTVIPINAILIGGTIDVIAAVTSLGSATVGVGTSAGSSTTAILAATAKASLTLAALLNVVPVFATPVKLTAEGSITFTVAAAALTAGIIDAMVLYIMPTAP